VVLRNVQVMKMILCDVRQLNNRYNTVLLCSILIRPVMILVFQKFINLHRTQLKLRTVEVNELL
jgi:hypothetical protein